MNQNTKEKHSTLSQEGKVNSCAWKVLFRKPPQKWWNNQPCKSKAEALRVQSAKEEEGYETQISEV